MSTFIISKEGLRKVNRKEQSHGLRNQELNHVYRQDRLLCRIYKHSTIVTRIEAKNLETTHLYTRFQCESNEPNRFRSVKPANMCSEQWDDKTCLVSGTALKLISPIDGWRRKALSGREWAHGCRIAKSRIYSPIWNSTSFEILRWSP